NNLSILATPVNPAGMVTSQTAWPDPVAGGAPLTYTLYVTNTGIIALTATITDVLPAHITPPAPRVWQTILAPGATWSQTVVVTVEVAYTGALTNILHVTTLEGPAYLSTLTIRAAGGAAGIRRAADAFPSHNHLQSAASSFPGEIKKSLSAGASGKSNTVSVSVVKSGWCAQRSYWEGTVQAGPLQGQYLRFSFRDSSGKYASSNWQIPGVYGFWNTNLHLWACGCADPAATQTITVVADGTTYTQSGKGTAQMFHFGPIASNHNVRIETQCSDDPNPPPPSAGVVLIDPDGFVFNIDKGGDYSGPGGMFNPVEAMSGVTVTCMVSMPQWGGWIPWPAHVYNQTNPQVTDVTYSDGVTTTGYFAFFTPPGHYYLQVEGIPGYQAWRSPVAEVITEIVHVNVPYTPDPFDVGEGEVTLTPLQVGGQTLVWNGVQIAPSVITVPVGSVVAWTSALSNTNTPEEIARWFADPVFRVLSDRDPLLDTTGFDSGYLEPGRVYRRQFHTPGMYTYEVYGQSGRVIATGESPGTTIYLPLVLRNAP
ncbi:MAG: hypothetical protein JXA33_28795, partial [Anaerolineae bacterium]|nr:hypothetical protein [Anaerolineae bacterium]